MRTAAALSHRRIPVRDSAGRRAATPQPSTLLSLRDGGESHAHTVRLVALTCAHLQRREQVRCGGDETAYRISAEGAIHDGYLSAILVNDIAHGLTVAHVPNFE
jgi:hypothetical protein